MYGLCIITGGVLGITLVVCRNNYFNILRQDILYAACYGGIGVLVGSKLLYILISIPDITEHWAYYTKSLENFITLLSGGFVFYGGLIGALIGIFIYTRMYKISTLKMLDVLIPSVPLIHAVGRIGCFCAGCCYGMPYPQPLGVEFNASPVAPHGVSLFPIQLVESAINFLIFVILFKLTIKKRQKGFIAGIYLICYSLARFFLEYFRYDYERGFLLGISTSQWISLLLFPVGLIIIFGKDKTISET